jgi:hypothetical protein
MQMNTDRLIAKRLLFACFLLVAGWGHALADSRDAENEDAVRTVIRLAEASSENELDVLARQFGIGGDCETINSVGIEVNTLKHVEGLY